jgi:von Willebrand factor type A domain
MPEIRPQAPITIKQYGKVDLVICIDTTGSMSGVIEAVKTNIATHLIGGLKGQMARNQSPLDWRARVIGYGDLNEGEAVFESSFTSDESELTSTVMNIPRTGGGDEPESTLDAMLIASKSPWRTDVSAHRIVILFTDASPHPEMHSNTMSSGPRDVDEVVSQLTAQKVKLFIYAPNNPLYERLKLLPKAQVTLFPADKAHEGLQNLVDFTKEFEQMAKTISGDMLNTPGLASA